MPRQKKRSCKCDPLIDLPRNMPYFLREELVEATTPLMCESYAQSLIRFDRIITFSEMIRDRWNSKFRLADRPKPSEDRKGYELKAKIFSKTLDLIQEVHLLCASDPTGQMTALKWFVLIIDELQIDAVWFPDSPELGSKTQARKILQEQNSLIKGYKNPFSAESCPATFLLLEAARIFAESHDRFRRNYYTPFRQAREALATHLIKQAFLCKNNGERFEPSRQGRKKSNPYRERLPAEKI